MSGVDTPQPGGGIENLAALGRVRMHVLRAPEHARLFLEGVRVARRVVQMPALKPYFVRETRPGPGVVDDADLFEYMRSTAQTAWHMVGTCKMGADDTAVVDPELRVRGIGNLRVIDSSICPTIPASNTNIAAIAVGEKGADLLLAAASA